MLALPTEAPAAADWREAGAVDHVFTHFALTMTLQMRARREARPEGIWWPVERIAEAGLPTLFAKLAARGARVAGGGMSAPGFTGAGLDRADHLRLDPERIAGDDGERRRAAAGARRARSGARRGRAARLGAAGRRSGEILFLGLDDGVPLFAPLIRTEALGQRAWSVFRLLALMSGKDAAIWGAARALNEWHNRHRFCGICGTATAAFRAGWGRKCPGCGAEHFPRVDPVVIMLAEHEDKVLLGRQPQYPARPLFGAGRLRRARRIDRGGGGARD